MLLYCTDMSHLDLVFNYHFMLRSEVATSSVENPLFVGDFGNFNSKLLKNQFFSSLTDSSLSRSLLSRGGLPLDFLKIMIYCWKTFHTNFLLCCCYASSFWDQGGLTFFFFFFFLLCYEDIQAFDCVSICVCDNRAAEMEGREKGWWWGSCWELHPHAKGALPEALRVCPTAEPRLGRTGDTELQR